MIEYFGFYTEYWKIIFAKRKDKIKVGQLTKTIEFQNPIVSAATWNAIAFKNPEDSLIFLLFSLSILLQESTMGHKTGIQHEMAPRTYHLVIFLQFLWTNV